MPKIAKSRKKVKYAKQYFQIVASRVRITCTYIGLRSS